MNDKSNLEEISKICEEYLKMKKALFWRLHIMCLSNLLSKFFIPIQTMI